MSIFRDGRIELCFKAVDDTQVLRASPEVAEPGVVDVANAEPATAIGWNGEKDLAGCFYDGIQSFAYGVQRTRGWLIRPAIQGWSKRSPIGVICVLDRPLQFAELLACQSYILARFEIVNQANVIGI